MTNKFRPMAFGFHEHSDHSLDGGTTIEKKIDRAIELGRPSDCITEHGNMNSIAQHHAYCTKKKMIPVIGIEAYIINPLEPIVLNKKGQSVPNYNHITIHFCNEKAYQYFCKLTPIMESRAVVKYGERKPLMTFEELEEIGSEIVLGSGCLLGFTQKYILNGDIEKAKIMYEKCRSVVKPDRWFCEILPHIIDREWQKPTKDEKGNTIPGYFKPNDCVDGIPKDIQMLPNRFMLQMAKKYGDKCLISEDSHLSTRNDKIIQDVRLSNGSLESWRFYIDYSMESSDFWAEKLKEQLGLEDKQIEEMIDNSYFCLDQVKDCKFRTADTDGWNLPSIETVFGDKYKGKTNVQILHEFVQEVGRFPKKDHPRYQEYKDRYLREIELFHRNGTIDLIPYFFVVFDVVNWARKNSILPNVRGSAGGSILTYLLGMSVTDPIKWELPVERMMTVERVKSLPDIDCLGENMLLSTSEGEMSIKTISEMEVKDYPNLFSVNEFGDITEEKPLLVFEKGESEVYEFTTDSGEKISATSDHRVFTVDGWMSIFEAFERKTEILSFTGLQ